MSNYRLLLNVIFKTMAFSGAAWLVYIFTVGLFHSPDQSGGAELQYSFDLSLLENNSEKYFSVNGRELLVVKHQNNFSVFWSNDPVYGCRLKYEKRFIRAVCIDIKYNLQGYNAQRDQQLLKPDYKIIDENQLVVY